MLLVVVSKTIFDHLVDNVTGFLCHDRVIVTSHLIVIYFLQPYINEPLESETTLVSNSAQQYHSKLNFTRTLHHNTIM